MAGGHDKGMRLFLAVELEPEIREKMVRIQGRLAEDALKPVEPENIHVTLKFLGEVEEGKVSALVRALKGVRMAPFEIAVQKIGVFPNINHINVVWVGADGPLGELAKKVSVALAGLGFPEDERGFSPHITIARERETPNDWRKG